jgi:hypothetical protein
MSDYKIDDIQTTMGRAFWTKLNEDHGSSTWGPAIDYIYLIEQEMIAKITKDIELWHMAGVVLGGNCDAGLCTCNDIVGYLKEQ